ncbi:MAG: hypothetical protein RLT87_00735 [Gammaproteobacteria bacterium]
MLSSIFKKKRPNISPVLVMDALGVADRIAKASEGELTKIADELDAQYHKFRLRMPNSLVLETASEVRGTGEFSSVRMNDMFVMYSPSYMDDGVHKYLVASSILFQQMLISGFIPRGGLGCGLVLRRKDLILGDGFIDAYRASEKRGDEFKDICAIQLTPTAFLNARNSEHTYRLLCWYKGRFFVNPYTLKDPDLGEFSKERVLDLLEKSGANQQKLGATEAFLDGFEDCDAAMKPGSAIRKITGWEPSLTNRS